MRFVSWNVNGIRAVMNRGFMDILQNSKADVFCLQETKAQEEQVSHFDWPKDYHQFWHSAEKKGYSGTAIFSKQEPIDVTFGIGKKKHDTEGRVINAEFDDFFVVNVYTPNSQNELKRLPYRVGEWDLDFRKHLKKLEKKKPVIFCGDLNVAHQEIDIARPKANERNAGFTIEERTTFGDLLKKGFVDTFREFEKSGGHYSWWSYRANARANNVGWRLDYWCISTALRPRLKDAFIWSHVEGSDHCPVGMELE